MGELDHMDQDHLQCQMLILMGILIWSIIYSWSEYNFTMIFDTTLPSSGILVIEFPEANYPDRLGLRPDTVLYAPYPLTRTFV